MLKTRSQYRTCIMNALALYRRNDSSWEIEREREREREQTVVYLKKDIACENIGEIFNIY